MPNIWYHETKYPNVTHYEENKPEIISVVNEAELIDVYHYHGSWFEYTWDIVATTEDGNKINGKFDTWNHDEKLVGKQIKLKGSKFSVIK